MGVAWSTRSWSRIASVASILFAGLMSSNGASSRWRLASERAVGDLSAPGNIAPIKPAQPRLTSGLPAPATTACHLTAASYIDQNPKTAQLEFPRWGHKKRAVQRSPQANCQ